MGIQYGWYIPEQVIYVNYYDRVTTQEFADMNYDIMQTVANLGEQTIHIIQDESNIKSAPPEFARLLKSSVIAQGKISGCLVVIGKENENPLMKFVSTIGARMGNTRHQRFYHLAEAEAYLEAIDPSIDFYQAQRHYLEQTIARRPLYFATV